LFSGLGRLQGVITEPVETSANSINSVTTLKDADESQRMFQILKTGSVTGLLLVIEQLLNNLQDVFRLDQVLHVVSAVLHEFW
jgi:hypothetical protein